MKVYIVVGYGNESFDLNCIYTNKRLAELKADQLNNPRSHDLYYSVEEHEVIGKK